jgi:PAS domain S-box-containing protein
MKRSTSLVREQFLKEAGRSFGSRNHQEELPFLIFVTDPDTLEIDFWNLAARKYLGSGEKNPDFKKLIHPDDYQEFLLHMQSVKCQKKDGTEEITLRIKQGSRFSKKFHFRHRLYVAGTGKDQVIGIAKQLPANGKKQRSSLHNPTLDKALQKSFKKNRSLLQNISDGFCIAEVLFDLQDNPVDCILLEVNAALLKQVHSSNLQEKSMKEQFHGYEDEMYNFFGKVAMDRESVQFEVSGPGEKRFHVTIFPHGEDEDGQIGILFKDISPLKLHLENFKKEISETIPEESKDPEDHQLLKAIFDKTSIGIAVLKPEYSPTGDLSDFLYLKANDFIKDKNGKNIIGKSFLEANPKATENGVFNMMKRSILSGIFEELEIKETREAEKRWYRITTRRENGYLITSMEDISRRKMKSLRLKENVQFKKQIAKTSLDIIMILNLQEENVRYINRDMAAHGGRRKKDIDGMPLSGILPLIHPHDREKALDFHSKITKAKDKEILDIEFRFKSKDDLWEWFNARGKVFMRNKESNVCEYILLLRNIEQQKQTQKALLNAEKLSIKGEVARTLAHELRNPMASIGMAADVLSKKLAEQKNSDLENYIGIIKRSNGILNKLVTDLLNASNYSQFHPIKCCLAATLEKALKAAEDRIHLVGIKVNKNYSGTYNILGDPEKLKIAFLNIIINASEAMNPNQGVLHLKITSNTKDHILTITDNGCGMEKTQIDKLFDAFYTQKPQGVGIGLNSVKSILEEHDAKVLVDSELNEGTSFHLTFHRYESFQRT